MCTTVTRKGLMLDLYLQGNFGVFNTFEKKGVVNVVWEGL